MGIQKDHNDPKPGLQKTNRTEFFNRSTPTNERMFFFRRKTPMGRQPPSQPPPPPHLYETPDPAKEKAERKDGQEWLAYRDDAAEDSEDDVAPSDENENEDHDADVDESTRPTLGDQVEEETPSAQLVEGNAGAEEVKEEDDDKKDARVRKIPADQSRDQSGEDTPSADLLEGNAGSEKVKEGDSGDGTRTIHQEEAASLAGLERNDGSEDVVEGEGDDNRTRKIQLTLGDTAALAHDEMSFVSSDTEWYDPPRFRPDNDDDRDGKSTENTIRADKRRTGKPDFSRPTGSVRRRARRKRKSTATRRKRSNLKDRDKQDEISTQKNALKEKQRRKRQQPQPLTKQSVDGLPLEVLEYWKDSDEEDDCTSCPLEVVEYWEDSDEEYKCTLPESLPLSDWKARAWHRLSQLTDEATTGTLMVSPSPSHWKVRAWRRLCHQVPVPSASSKFTEERFRPRTLGAALTTKRLSVHSPHSSSPSSSSTSSSARKAPPSKTLPIQTRRSQGSSAKRRRTIGESTLQHSKRVPYTKEETEGRPRFLFFTARSARLAIQVSGSEPLFLTAVVVIFIRFIGIGYATAIIAGVHELGEGRWTEIKKAFSRVLKLRTAVDIKDKVRNLKRKREL
jgi:hypothetical protein